jgi:hypothetical protein
MSYIPKEEIKQWIEEAVKPLKFEISGQEDVIRKLKKRIDDLEEQLEELENQR